MTLLGLNPLFAKRLPDLIAAMTTNLEAGGIAFALASAAAEAAVFWPPRYAAGLAFGAGPYGPDENAALDVRPAAAAAVAVRNIPSSPMHP